MLKVIITLYGKTYIDLALAAQHATTQLKLGTPSERITWDDGAQVDYTVEKATEEEIEHLKNLI